MSEETISEEQILHNKLSFEINQELIHLMKRIIEIQQENQQLKIQVSAREEVANKYKKVIEEVREYIKAHQRKDEFLNLNEWQTRELLQILDKARENK